MSEAECKEVKKKEQGLAIRVYVKVEGGRVRQGFVDLYKVLDCYGTHLVKDVWGLLERLVEEAEGRGRGRG